MNTLLLDRTTWDLCVDANGNIAMASEPYSLAQDAASAIKLFLGELWYDTSQGIPYFSRVLGHYPSLAYLKATLVETAMTVPDVAAALCFITSVIGREVSGQVQVTSAAGVVSIAAF